MIGVSVVTLAYGAEPWLEPAVEACLASEEVDVQVVVVDNGCTDGAVDRLEGRDGVVIIRPGKNTGFAGGCNVGVDVSSHDIVALVNPDAIVEPAALARLAEAALRPDVGIATASVRLADRPEKLNSAGNQIHCSGMSWSGSFEEDAKAHDHERIAFAASGCAMAMQRARWEALGGFDPLFFAYYEDADLSVRSWHRGWKVVYVPEAVVLHRYEFSRRAEKYFLLERNRLLLVSGCYARRTLLLLSPLLLAIEGGVLLLALREGWVRQKWSSWVWLVRHRREVMARRQRIQRERSVDDHSLASLFSDDLLPSNYEIPKGWTLVNGAVRAYWHAVKRRI